MFSTINVEPFFLFIAKCACPLLYKDQLEDVLNMFFPYKDLYKYHLKNLY